MIQNNIHCHELLSEEPGQYLLHFLKLTDGMKANGVPQDDVRLCLFPCSLIGKERKWLNRPPLLSITSWPDLMKKFMTRYYPPAKSCELQRR
ncbi:unnamed protein product [Linum trigynum]|uniref:Retrotransposon gag domain-containing protein n=1 Tax=Linum trigynum TaxID=586398 RepID=A0AAV2E8K0_9ROSI